MVNQNNISQAFKEILNQLERKGIVFEDETDLFSNFSLAIKLQGKNILEILERDVSKFGNGSHVILPQKHVGKKSIVIIEK